MKNKVIVMTSMSFKFIDDTLKFLPSDINRIIYDYYDSLCPECECNYNYCKSCDILYCFYHNCNEECSKCKKHLCVLGKSYRICACHKKRLCHLCYYL